MTKFTFFARVTDLRLDLVGLLTVIGESAMAIHAQVVTASWICCLPRLITAPQAFLQPHRPSTLPTKTDCIVVGIYSGNVKHHLNYFPSIMHDMDKLPKYCVYRRKIVRTDTQQIAPKILGPVGILAGIGVVLDIGLFILAIIEGDGSAIVALFLLSLTSCLSGIGSKWELKMPQRKKDGQVPPGDVLVKDTKGSFLIIECEEHIARELYFAKESCEYFLSDAKFRVCSAISTLSLMAAVVFLANCQWNLQAAIGLIYIFLNAAYWSGAVLPLRFGWKLDMFKIEKPEKINKNKIDKPPSYTDCLWDVAKDTKTMQWAHMGGITPDTEAWKEWVNKASEKCKFPEDWDYQGEHTDLMNKYASKFKNESRKDHGNLDNPPRANSNQDQKVPSLTEVKVE